MQSKVTVRAGVHQSLLRKIVTTEEESLKINETFYLTLSMFHMMKGYFGKDLVSLHMTFYCMKLHPLVRS